MEGISANNSSSSSSSSSKLFGGKDMETNSSSSGLFSSVFPHPSLVGEKGSATTDIFNSPKKQDYADQKWNQAHKATADDYIKGNMSKENKYINKDKSSSYKGGERSDPCFLSNSLYYGGQDICAQPQTSESSYNYENNGKDDSNNSDFASRGNWWQGSLYY